MTAPIRPAVARLVAAVRTGSALGPCWVLTAPLGRVAVIATTADGPTFAGQFRRANLDDARGRELLDVHPQTGPVPQYQGGGSQWAWTPRTVGRQIRITTGGDR